MYCTLRTYRRPRVGRLLTFLAALAAAALPATTLAEDAQSIIAKMQELQMERYEDVDTYVVVQSVVGNRVAVGYERFDFEASDGNVYPVFGPMRQGSSNPSSQAFLETYANSADMMGGAVGNQMENDMEKAGLPKGTLGGMSGGDPWASMDPRVMMGANAEFLRQAAAAEGQAPEAQDFNGIEEFARRARLVGTEKVNGRKAFYLIAEGLEEIEQDGSEEFLLQTVEAWIDTREYVPLRMKMSGIATTEGESRPFEIEKIDSDYRTVPNSGMYEAYNQVLKIGGALTPEQEAQMQEAQKQMADLDKQLADLDPSQREMILARMGPQLEMIEQMANGGGLQMTIEVHEIVVNADLAELQRLQAANFGGAAAPVAAVPATSYPTAPAAPAAPAAPESDLQAAQQACLQERMAAAQEAQEKKRGFGRLMRAATRVAGRYGGVDTYQTMGDVYTAGATADDVSQAAKDLGLTESDIEACRNPG